MTENRYYKKDWGESYYIFDSKTLPESEFEERVEYEGYDVFADSLIGNEIIDLLNENEQLKSDKELFAECICNLSNLLCENKIEHDLPKNIEDFIIAWGVRIE